MPQGGILKEGGQKPKYRIPIFRYFGIGIYNTDTEPIFLRLTVYHTYTGIPVFSARFCSLSVSITDQV